MADPEPEQELLRSLVREIRAYRRDQIATSPAIEGLCELFSGMMFVDVDEMLCNDLDAATDLHSCLRREAQIKYYIADIFLSEGYRK